MGWEAAILGILESMPKILDFVDRGIAAFERQVAVNEASARLEWSQALQGGLQPLEQGRETTDEEKAAAVKAVADAWAKMPSK